MSKNITLFISFSRIRYTLSIQVALFGQQQYIDFWLDPLYIEMSSLYQDLWKIPAAIFEPLYGQHSPMDANYCY